MDMSISFIADFQASKRVKPRERAFHWPTRLTQAAAVRRADFGELWNDTPLAQALTVFLRTVASVTLDDFGLAQRTPGLATNRRNRLDQRVELRNVVAIGRSQDDRERDALRVGDEVVLTAELAPVGRVWTSFFPAITARTEELSTKARDISSRSRRRISASKVSWMRCHTPAFCHASSRRQHTVPEPQPISCGSRFHGVPERSTYTMPVSTARSGIGLRPAYRRLRDARTGSNGSISDHSSSSMSSLGIASCQAKQGRKLTPSGKS